jgi:integrase
MASIHLQRGTPNWFCYFTTPDGVRRTKSTKTQNKKQATIICKTWERAALEQRKLGLTPDRARDIISRGISEIYVIGNKEAMPGASLRAWCTQWNESKAIQVSKGSSSRYFGVIKSFLEYLGARADKDVSTIRAMEVMKWRDGVAQRLSVGSANLSLKALRSCFADAVKQGLTTNNPAGQVKILQSNGSSSRRELSPEEIQRVLAKCDEEWRGLVLFGLYTGQRLGDLARLKWHSVDTSKGNEKWSLTLTTKKTGRRMYLPLVITLQDYLLDLTSIDDPSAPLFPRAHKVVAEQGRVGTLSNRFRDILVDAGLVELADHRAKRKGRAGRRQVSTISFHSLRHSAVTLLKASGVSDAIAREIVGHESAAVNRGYTHLSAEDMRPHLDKMPKVTK